MDFEFVLRALRATVVVFGPFIGPMLAMWLIAAVAVQYFLRADRQSASVVQQFVAVMMGGPILIALALAAYCWTQIPLGPV